MTEIAKHTPGPWKVDVAGRQIKIRPDTANGSTIATMTTYYLSNFRRANARLIAAAPELLDVLQQLSDHAGYVPTDPESQTSFDQVVIAARDAIAKATPPSPAPGEGK